MADNYSDFNSDESADEGPGNPIAEAKRLGVKLRSPEKAKIARETKLIQPVRAAQPVGKVTQS